MMAGPAGDAGQQLLKKNLNLMWFSKTLELLKLMLSKRCVA